jgi:hypothetical protein
MASGIRKMALYAAVAAVTCGLAACSGENIAAEEQAMRSPERLQKKTAEALSIADAGGVTVSNIELTKSPRGKSLIVVWRATGPDGTSYLCNSDKRVDFPICEAAS